MKKKSKMILGAVLVIVLCASLITGATFALFTSESTVSISVTSGNVNVEATMEVVSTKSFGVEQKDGKWENGGFAKVNGANVQLENITPGDEVELKVAVENKSSVSVKYRYSYEVSEGYLLASGLDVTFDGVMLSDKNGKYMTYATEWLPLSESDEVSVTVTLPNHEGNIDNLYQSLSTNLAITVEAVQANGATANGAAAYTYLPDYTDAIAAVENGKVTVVDEENTLTETIAAAQAGDYLVLAGDATWGDYSGAEGVVVDANGYTLSAANTGAIMHVDGLTVKNAVLTRGDTNAWGLFSKTSGANYYNCVFTDIAPYVDGHEDMVIDGCTFYSTLQFCFDETVKDSHVLPDNLVITDNVFYVNNENAGAHAIVFNGGEKAEWEFQEDEAGKAIPHVKNIVMEGNVFNPVYANKSYIAYYIVTNEKLEGTIRTFPENTYNGLAKYSVNGVAAENQYNLTSATEKLDLKNAETAMALLCPDCVNGKVTEPHSNHSIYDMLEIDADGVATVKKEGAWIGEQDTDWTKQNTISYTLDVTAFGEGDLIVMDFGEDAAWAGLLFGVKKTAEGYAVGTGTAVSANVKSLSDTGVYEIECVTYVNDEGKFVREVYVDGELMLSAEASVNAGNFYWDIYTCVGAYAKISNLVVA